MGVVVVVLWLFMDVERKVKGGVWECWRWVLVLWVVNWAAWCDAGACGNGRRRR